MKVSTGIRTGNFLTDAANYSCKGLQNAAKFLTEAEHQARDFGSILASKAVYTYNNFKNSALSG